MKQNLTYPFFSGWRPEYSYFYTEDCISEIYLNK